MSDDNTETSGVSSEGKALKVTPSTVQSVEAEEQKQAKEIFEKFEAFALQNPKQGLDFNKLSSAQVDKVLDTMQQNETNAYNYHCKRLDTLKEINLADIRTKGTSHRTIRILFIIGVLAVFILTIVILIWAKDFFLMWLTFLGGNLSGIGFSKLGKVLNIEPTKPITMKDKSEEDN